MNYIPQSLQEQIDKIYDDAWNEMAWCESYEELFDICRKGEQKVNELLNQK